VCRYVQARTYQLSRWSHAGLLVRREVLESSPWLVLHEHDRYFYRDPTVLDPSLRVRLMAVHHVDQRPMVHHYTMVSHEVHVVTMEGMLSRTYIELFFSMALLFIFCVQLEFALLSESLPMCSVLMAFGWLSQHKHTTHCLVVSGTCS
jgi:hypothetical protein